MTALRRPLLEFPCLFPLKVIGRNIEEFEVQTMRIIAKHVPESDKGHCSRRLSKSDKYLALTISFIAHSQEQLDALYQELHDHELVLVTL